MISRKSEQKRAAPEIGNGARALPAQPAVPAGDAFTRARTRLLNALKWLYPGVHVKRYLLIVFLGILLTTAGIDLLFIMQLADLGDRLNAQIYSLTGIILTDRSLATLTYQALIGLPLATLGLLLMFYGFRNTLVSITTAVVPQTQGPLVDVILKRRHLAQGYRIVVIGGGTGLSTLLRGLKEYTSNITAVVTVTDDGGSSGRLQREFGMLPPGDIRNCLVALADAEPLMQELFQYRFEGGGEALKGHSFGNLLIAAMLNITGDFEEAVRQTSRVLAIRGRVLPSTLAHVCLRAELVDATIAEGETNISRATQPIQRMMLSDPEAEPLDETLEALRTADAILIGPGSVYTSVIPNFLVKGVAEAVARSNALKIYICNVMTQPGETSGFSAADHVRAIEQQAGRRVFDYVLINQDVPGEDLLERYAQAGSYWVHPDLERIRQMGYRPVVGQFISQTHVVRHDPLRLAQAIVQLLNSRARQGW
ncbi:MAG: YvcK family protein [Armatimonadetes bacterium]|nr:YvcK family protein [Armatimonadota bacterium]